MAWVARISRLKPDVGPNNKQLPQYYRCAMMDTLAGSPFGLVQRAARFFAFFTLFFPRSDDFSFKSLICKVLSFEKFLWNEISRIYLGKVWWNSSWRLVRIFIRIFRFFRFCDCTISLWNLRFLTREQFLWNELFGFHLENIITWNIHKNC